MSINADVINFVVPTGTPNGEPVDINAYATLHAVPGGQTHEVYVMINNPNSVDTDVNIRFGTSGSNIVTITVPAKSIRMVINGMRVSGGAPASTIQAQGSGCRGFCIVNRVA